MNSKTDPPHGGNLADLAARIAPHLAAILAELVPQPRSGSDLLTLVEAARVAGLPCRRDGQPSTRVLRDAIRAGDLPAFGRQRDRTVRRDDLERWVESRRVVHEAIDDRDIERRMRRLASANDDEQGAA